VVSFAVAVSECTRAIGRRGECLKAHRAAKVGTDIGATFRRSAPYVRVVQAPAPVCGARNRQSSQRRLRAL